MENDQTVDKKKEGAPRPKGFVKPQPGKFAVKQKVVMEHTPGEEGEFVHDTSVLSNLSDAVASRIHPFEEQNSHDPQNFETFGDRVYSFHCMLMAKKLATALSDDQNLAFGGYLGAIARVPVYAPSALIQLFDLFGAINHEEHRFSMIAQPILCLTYFARAVLPIGDFDAFGQYGRRETLFVNLAWAGAKRQLYDFCVGTINAWANSVDPQNFQFADNMVVQMTVPSLTQGAAAYAAFIAAVPKPPLILRFLRISALIEPFINVDLPAGLIQQLQGEGVGVVNWNTNNISENCGRYSTLVESRVRMSFAKATNWVSVSMMKTHGSPGQLLQKRTESLFYSPIMLGGDVLDLGWMVASFGTYVRQNPRACYLVPPHTTTQGNVSFVEGMLK